MYAIEMSENHYRRIKTIKASNTNKFHLIHIISCSLDMSEGKSDQSEKTTESRNEKEIGPEEANPGIG